MRFLQWVTKNIVRSEKQGMIMLNKLLCFMWSCQFSQGNFMTDWFNAPHEYITEYTECKHCGGLNHDNQN